MKRGRPVKLSDAQKEELFRRYKEGKPLKVLALEFGVCEGTVRRYKREAEIPSLYVRDSKTSEQDLRMNQEGWTMAEIARYRGVSRQAVSFNISRRRRVDEKRPHTESS